MIYLWVFPENYIHRHVGRYEEKCSPDRFLLKQGRKLNNEEFKLPTIIFKTDKAKLLKYDSLVTNAMVPLINKRLKAILENMAPDDVQFFQAKCICTDGELEDYYFLNITHTVVGLDYEKSIFTKMLYGDYIRGFTHAVYKSDCMGKHDLARDEEYSSHLLVTEKVKAIFDKEQIKGLWLVSPEEYYP